MSEEPEITPPVEPDNFPAKPEIHANRRWNMVWVVPVVAALLGAWLLARDTLFKGPMAEVRFETAAGIEAGKTDVRCRNVRVGMVRGVKLSDDLSDITASIEFSDDGQKLMRRGSRFWVVRPRLSPSGISGVDTLITGAYIEMEPGPENAERETKFVGLEKPPGTNSTVPGLRLVLHAEEASTVMGDSPIYYRGFPVGRIEEPVLDAGMDRVRYGAFIEEKYAQLITENTRFWNASGIDIAAGTNGFRVRTPSIQSLLSGGVSFGVPDSLPPGKRVANGHSFTLYPDASTAEQSTFNPQIKFLLLFETVRGLSKRAPVEFRGITIGRVADISLNLAEGSGEPRIPVLIEVDPDLMRPENASGKNLPEKEFFREEIAKGLRASLRTASLITGALYVDLDRYPDAPTAEMGHHGEYDTLPTVSSGFAQLEAKLSAILDKIQALPLEKTMNDIATAAAEAKTTVAGARDAMDEIARTAAALRKTLEDPKFRGLPTDLNATLTKLQNTVESLGSNGPVQGDLLRSLDELREALRSMKSLTNSIEEKPASLLWGKDSSGNPKPKAPRR